MEIVIQVVAAILVFGLLIFVHELGHFTVGKLSGMRVNQFAIGMGPAIQGPFVTCGSGSGLRLSVQGH